MTSAVVPALGTMTLTGGYGRLAPEQAISVLTYALASGVSLFDTADAYFGGEALLASVRASAPERPVRIVTKVGLVGRPGHRLVCGRPSYLARACDASLRRLGGDRLDVLLLHRVDPFVPVEDSLGALGALAQAGKVAEVGLCTSDPGILCRAAAAAPISFVQAQMSVLAPSAARVLLPVAREIGATFLARSPLDRGLVVANRDPADLAVDDARAYIPEIWAPARRSLAMDFRQLADHLGATAADLALGWLVSLGPDVIPIPGARSQAQVAENVRAQRRQLPDDQIQALDAFVRRAGLLADDGSGYED